VLGDLLGRAAPQERTRVSLLRIAYVHLKAYEAARARSKTQ
jgi:2-dehydropantoate 2-reductase